MGVKSTDQEAAPPPPPALPPSLLSFKFSFRWPGDGDHGLSPAGRRISDVMVGNGEGGGVSSLSSQRSIISDVDVVHEPARSDGASFGGAIAVVEAAGLVKNEESFDWPGVSFFCFCFDVPVAAGLAARGRLRDSRDSCGGLSGA